MFDLPAERDLQRYVCRCATCSSPDAELLWNITGTLAQVSKADAARALKDDGEAEREDDPFLSEELLLASLLAAAWGRVWREKAEPRIREALTAQPFSRQRLDDALADAGRDMSDVFGQDDIEGAMRIANDLITNGAIDAAGEVSQPANVPLDRVAHRPITVNYHGLLANTEQEPVAAGTIIEGAPSVAQVHEGIVQSARYYTNRYFNENVMPWIHQRVDAIIDGTDPTGVPTFNEMVDLMGRRLRSVPYWRVVANAAASRAYHYGFLKAAQIRGAVTQYRIVAVLDERTSDICMELHGRVFSLADGIRLIERIAQAEDTEAVKQISPWRKVEEVRNRSVSELRDMGCIVPPFHGLCRTTIRFV